MADRDREAAEDGAAIWRVFPKTLAEIVASERAAATAACAAHVEEHISRAVGRAWIAEEIRALSPEGWCAVKRDDLDVLMRTFPHVSARCDCTLQYADECAQECVDFDEVIDRIRAALARRRMGDG